MKVELKTRFRIPVLLASALYALGLLVATHIPKAQMTAQLATLLDWDKALHSGAYGVLTWLALSAWKSGPSLKGIAGIAVVVMVLSGLDEWTQPWVGRTGSVADWLADAIGTGLALAGWCAIARKKNGAGRRNLDDTGKEQA